METDKLPNKVVELEVLRINRNIDKRCKCYRWERNFTIDTTNKKVYCRCCGAEVDPYEALEDIAEYYERLQNHTKMLLEQRKQIDSYKPWMVVFRDLERQYREKKMLPVCPHCDRAFYFEEISQWTNRELEEKRRQRKDE